MSRWHIQGVGSNLLFSQSGEKDFRGKKKRETHPSADRKLRFREKNKGIPVREKIP